MRQLFFTLILICSFNTLFAQEETADYKHVAAKFESFYNKEQYDSIFAMFDKTLQQLSPLDKTTEFLKSVQANAGKINKREFITYKSTWALYKTSFEKALLTLNISIESNALINGLNVTKYIAPDQRNITNMKLPFKGEWTVVWGGDTKELNYHVENIAQKNAFDIVIKKDKSFRTDGKTNEDYYAFGEQLMAPCDGEIVMAVDGVKDNIPGEMNPMYATGNSVIIKTDKNEFVVLAHFKNHSITVKEGQKVKQGQLLGLCGNSGNSSEPHLHLHIQNMEQFNNAVGIKCYFDHLNVNGISKSDYSPIQNDKIKQ